MLLAAPVGARTVDAHGFGTSANPDHYVADGMPHTYASTESTASEKITMEAWFNGRMTTQYDQRTDMTVLSVGYTSFTDAYWYVTTAVGTADATCMNLLAGNICERVRIRFNTTWAANQTTNEKRQGACHEIGHSVGFDDSIPEVATGCMSGGGLGVLSAHEIGHINDQYP
jgi:hypothetical protein